MLFLQVFLGFPTSSNLVKAHIYVTDDQAGKLMMLPSDIELIQDQ